MVNARVSIVGGSGYVGGELLRLLLFHPHVTVHQITSRGQAGKPVSSAHPTLRKRTSLVFSDPAQLEPCDCLFLCMPHGYSSEHIDQYRALAPEIIDLSADFRIKDPDLHGYWYGKAHPRPELLAEFVYGIPELHRESMRKAKYISSAGCNATAVILALYPFYKKNLLDVSRTVVEVKAGASEGGNSPAPGSHYPDRSGSIRSYKPAGHRHIAEMTQELGLDFTSRPHFSATSINMVRGIHAVSHIFPVTPLAEKDIWKLYREYYGAEPFIRIIKEKEGFNRYPDPKLLAGTNFCDIGFEKDADSHRIVVFSAIDNLMKGAAGQALQAYNIMHNLEETTGLEFTGLYPL